MGMALALRIGMMLVPDIALPTPFNTGALVHEKVLNVSPRNSSAFVLSLIVFS